MTDSRREPAMVRKPFPRHPAFLRVVGAVVTGMVVLSGAGCSNDAGAPASSAPPTDAAGSPEASPATPTSIDPATFLDRLVEVQLEARTVHVVLEGVIAGRAELDFGADGVGAKVDVSISVAGQPVRMRTIDGTTYLTYPDLGEQWISIDPDQTGPGPWAEAAESAGVDPLAQVEELRRAVTGIEHAGRFESLDGDIEDHYTVTVDATRLEGAEPVLELGIEEIVYHYVLDGAGLPRSMYYEMADQYVSLKMSGWGTPVNIVAPDPALVRAVDGSQA